MKIVTVYRVQERESSQVPVTIREAKAATTASKLCLPSRLTLKSVRVSRKNFVRIVLAVTMLTIVLPRRSVPFPGLPLQLSEHLGHVFHLIPDVEAREDGSELLSRHGDYNRWVAHRSQ